MRVRILKDSDCADFSRTGRTGKVGSKRLKAGDKAEYPDDYAQQLIDAELAVLAGPEVIEMTAPEVLKAEAPQDEPKEKLIRGQINPEVLRADEPQDKPRGRGNK